ncbi:MAG: OmpA family protein [Saprospiraceae bacterium]
MAFDLTSNTMFFTRTYKTFKISGQDTMYLKIFATNLDKSKPKTEKLKIQDGDFSLAHPTLNSQGNLMVLSSNMKPNKGKMDLFWTDRRGDNWTDLMPVSDSINSSANEIFPVLFRDSILIFASDRPGGFGGLDLYLTIKKGLHIWSKPILLPKPFNSNFDDFSLIVREDGKSGYFTSNRPGGKGKDDIYSFSADSDLFIQSDVLVSRQIVVMDKLTLEPIVDAKVSIIPLDIDINNFTLTSFNIDVLAGTDPGDLLLKLTPKRGKPLADVHTDIHGVVFPNLSASKQYIVQVSADNYDPISLIFEPGADENQFNVVMTPFSVMIEDERSSPNADPDVYHQSTNVFAKGTTVVFEDIYYAYNKADILENHAHELDALTSALKEDPNMNVRLEAHTDARGNDKYNLQLSIRRAEAARNYLEKKGIDPERIEIKGYGESRIRNHCLNGVPCTEMEHKYNRRTEVVIQEDK